MGPKTQNIINKIIISEMFDNFAIFPIPDFWESAEFNKNKDWQDINWFTKHFADIFRVQKWPTFYIETIVQGAAIAQSLQGFIRSALITFKKTTVVPIQTWYFIWDSKYQKCAVGPPQNLCRQRSQTQQELKVVEIAEDSFNKVNFVATLTICS